MIKMFVVCGLLFIIDGVYSMYIFEGKDVQVPEKQCNINPANSSLPCREFVFTDSRYCDEQRLQKIFPELYTRVDPDGVNWPAKVEKVSSKNSSTEWTVSQNGNINFLKGFQVIQSGTSYDTYLMTFCSVIDLSNMTDADLLLLMKTKFYINNKDASSFDVQIKPLPFPPDDFQSTGITETMEENKTLSEYHSEINVNITYNQINSTSVNISVGVSGETWAIDYMEIKMWYKDNREFLQDVQTQFYLSEKSFIVNGLKEGNFTLKLTPIETNAGVDDDTCICYFGTNTSRQCEPCIGYTKTIHVEKWTENLTADDSMVGIILAPVLALSTMVIIAVSIWYIWYKDIIPSCIHLPEVLRKRQPSDFTSIDNEHHTKRPTIHIIQAYDHAPHKSAVDSLENLINTTTNYIVVADKRADPRNSQLSANTEVNTIEKSHNLADLICIVHSDWAHKLVSVINSGEVTVSDLTNDMDKQFLTCVNEVCQNPAIASKFVSVRFEYTPESAIIKEPFLGPQFNLPTNTDAFIKHLHSRKTSQSSNIVNVCTEDKMALISSINAAFVYQSKHKSWLFTKLFNLRNSPYSDDSGIVLRRSKTKRSRSIRSKSAETISFNSCTCDINSAQTMCDMCYHKQSSRLRTHSCDLSFYPPESTVDGTSERLSLLENKFVDINSRYFLTLEAGDFETIDRQSV